MTERDYAPLSTACVRGLCDKLYDKRKFAGVEIEKMVKDFSDANNTSQIKRLIRVLGQDLMSSTNPNVKNGALMGLSSVAVGLGKGCVGYVDELLHPIVACLGEGEARVRYAAAEALFNVLKIARGAALVHFPLIFDALARLAADPEPQVKQGAELLDRLVKDIVTESATFEVAAFVPLVRERMYTRAASARQFAVAWVSALDAAPALPLRRHLPDLLDGLFTILDDPNPEIRRMCDVQLNEFLRSIKKEPEDVDFQAMINILITHAQSPEELLQLQSLPKEVGSEVYSLLAQLTALTWVKEFVALAGARMLPAASGILCAALPCLAYGDEPRRKIRETAATVNSQLIKLVVSETPEAEAEVPTDDKTNKEKETDKEAATESKKEGPTDGKKEGQGDEEANKDDKPTGELELSAVVGVLAMMLHHSSVHTKVAALDWILHLYNKLPSQMWGETERVFGGVVGCLTDASDDVVRRTLAVLAEICTCPCAPAAAAPAAPATVAPAPAPADPDAPPETISDLESNPYYYKFLRALLRLLAADETLLEDRGAFIIRQLCVLLPAEEVYRAVARVLLQGVAGGAGEQDVRFAARLVDVLSAMLLCAPELHATRRQLRAFDRPATHALFRTLYSCWCHSPVALLALCLLTHNYAHCNELIATFGDLEITVDFLTEVDKLVQLIESPIFAYLRLELLGAHSAALRSALFGLLMLLPQGAAFSALRHRLHCAPPPPPLPGAERAGAGAPAVDLEALLEEFKRVQAAQRAQRLLERPRRARPAP